MSAAALGPQAGPPPGTAEPHVRGESDFDRVSSMLLAVILGAGLIFGWLAIVYATNQAYQRRVTAPLEIVDVSGGGGGSPEGEIGGIETVQVPGGAEADRASNNEEEPAEFEEASVQAAPAAMLDTVAEAGQNLAEVDVGAVMPTGGKVATGKRASKIGNGAVGYGFGPGDGGVRKEDRWTILANPGQTADEYARQLDALRIELAVVRGNQLTYVSNFSSDQPTLRSATGVNEGRLYFLWRGQGRKGSDLALLRKAGIEVGEGVIFQFYPPGVEQRLTQLEVQYKGRQPAEIRRTQFRVIPASGGYDFEVVSQETLR